MKKINFEFPTRQIHLDFHTSPLIDDVGSEFDAKEFAKTMKQAHVNSVTIFAKCHHGMCYYPTKTGTPHPALKGKDLLGEMIEALHREKIRAPIYTTVVWEEDVAFRFPQWRQLKKNGMVADWSARNVGAWKFNNFLHPEYQDYIESHIEEIMKNYKVDGFFFDILFMHGEACWSSESIKFREKHGLLSDDRKTFDRFQALAQHQFGSKFAKIVKSRCPDATVFFNSGHHAYIDTEYGSRLRDRSHTHWEIESLPSGFWGYYHFPRIARLFSFWDKPWLGMTGRFQQIWGDFGGIKPQPALEYECFRTQALNGANSVGDQLPPRGTLDRAAYKLIGSVFEQCENAEPFYKGSVALPQIGIFLASMPGCDENKANTSEEGAVLICEETHYDMQVLDDASKLDGLDLLILPDTATITKTLKAKLKKYYENGGKLVLSFESGFDSDGHWALDFLPLKFSGKEELFPTYWRARKDFTADLSISDRVFYQQGLRVKGGRGVKTLVDRVLPYFNRTDLTFSSHRQTPPISKASLWPAVVRGDRFVYFADPIFREYRKSGNMLVREVLKPLLESMLGQSPFGAQLPLTVLSVPRRRGNDLILTLLHYIPLRKCHECEVIEERLGFGGEKLHLPPQARTARVFGSNQALKRNPDGSFELPAVKGRLLLEVPDFFKTR